MGICRNYCKIIDDFVCCFECSEFKECIVKGYVCNEIIDEDLDRANYHTCENYIGEKSTMISDIKNNNNNSNKITVYVYGNPDAGHTTKVCNNGKEAKFYCDGWDGTTYKQICNLLDIIGIEYFTVIKKRG